ncbi:MAG TPA: presenilin family intramembrane aspartyl protease [archaeon]|nr:presenilin family intramembrane aspartyl protease [archaeon]
MDKRLLFQLILLFVLTQAIGLFVAFNLISGISAGTIEQPGIITQNPDDIANALFLIAYILVGTGFFLFAIKFVKRPWLFKVLELFILFFTAGLLFEFALGEPWGILLAIILVASRIIFRKNIWLRNLGSIISSATVGALVGITLGVIPILVFITALSIYDYIAVFKTKHMVTLAKGIQGKNLGFTLAMPTPKHTFELGTGDLVIPLAFATSAMQNSLPLGFPNYFFIAIFILLGSIVGLILTLEYLSKRIGTALPALPLQTAIMIVIFAAAKLAGF